MSRTNYKTMSKEVLSKQIFHDASGNLLALREVMKEIKKYVLKDPIASYEIVIGSDSQAARQGSARFITAVVVRRIGNGGIHFWIGQEEKFYNFKDRIWKEAILSITLAQEFRSCMKDELGEEMFWEGQLEFRCIHLDIGKDGPTSELIDGISGMVKGYGFEPVIKPYSYGAFVVADRHT
jgi:predicted RNase H-related nuclease YkuK (DUF458 family)